MARILILGCGDIGRQLGKCLVTDGHSVMGVRRSSVTDDSGIEYLSADLGSDEDVSLIPTSVDMIVFMVTPDGRTEEAYRHVFDTVLTKVLDRFSTVPFIFISSTSVYGQNAGELVDEDSPTQAARFNGQWLVKAEERLQQESSSHVVVRFSGIYGPGRFRLISKALESVAVQKDPPLWTNRIHRDDCVGLLKLIIEKKLSGEPLSQVYLATDNEPTPTDEVMAYLRSLCGLDHELLANEGTSQNKRCYNGRVRELGYEFIYPNYRSYYPQLVAEYLKERQR